MDHTFIGTSENVVQNVLMLPRLERHHLHSRLRCQARNNNLTNLAAAAAAATALIVSSVQIDLNRKIIIIDH